MKAFNCARDPPSQETKDKNPDIKKLYAENGILNQIPKEVMEEYITKLDEYESNAPVLSKDIVVYSGRTSSDYNDLKKTGKITTNRYISATFDKEFANHYAMLRKASEIKKGNASDEDNLIVYKIVVPAGTRGLFYVRQENQVVFLPGKQIQITGEPLIDNETEKDIFQKDSLGHTYSVENVNVVIN